MLVWTRNTDKVHTMANADMAAISRSAMTRSGNQTDPSIPADRTARCVAWRTLQEMKGPQIAAVARIQGQQAQSSARSGRAPVSDVRITGAQNMRHIRPIQTPAARQLNQKYMFFPGKMSSDVNVDDPANDYHTARFKCGHHGQNRPSGRAVPEQAHGFGIQPVKHEGQRKWQAGHDPGL